MTYIKKFTEDLKLTYLMKILFTLSDEFIIRRGFLSETKSNTLIIMKKQSQISNM